MTITVPSSQITAAAERAAPRESTRATGLMIASVFPALFWTAVIAGVGAHFDNAFSLSALLGIGSTITLFLFTICSALMGAKA